MNLIRTILFWCAGLVGILNQLFGIFVILYFIADKTGAWLNCILWALVIILIDVWKHIYFKGQGMKAKLGGYQ